MNRLLESPLSGIIPPLVTPLLNNDMLDIKGLECLIEHLIDGGVHALFILGTTGEAQCLSYRLRQEMIRETCRITQIVCRYWFVYQIHLLWRVSDCLKLLLIMVRRLLFQPLHIILLLLNRNWSSSMNNWLKHYHCLFSYTICLHILKSTSPHRQYGVLQRIRR